jgi:hypothetical protein
MKAGVSSPFRKTLTAPLPARYLSLVDVAEELRVNDKDGLAGICTSCLPQYFMRAIFDGLFQAVSFIIQN